MTYGDTVLNCFETINYKFVGLRVLLKESSLNALRSLWQEYEPGTVPSQKRKFTVSAVPNAA